MKRGLQMKTLSGVDLKTETKGFTLIELALVTVLILTLISLSVPLFKNTLQTLKLDNSCRDVCQLVRYLQTRSVVEGKNHRLQLDYSRGTYRAEIQSRGSTMTERFEPLRESVGRTRTVSSGVQMKGDTPSIHFYPDSRIDDAHILFKDLSDFTYSLNIRNSTISINTNSTE